jgi:D-amino-acid dehydrogenase
MSEHAVVIGAGIIGLCVAEALLCRGFRVTVLDRSQDLTNECSFGNGGLIVPSHFVPLAAPGMIQTGLRMLGNPKSPFGIRNPLNWETLTWTARFAQACSPDHVARCAPLLRDLNLASRGEYHRLFSKLGLEEQYHRKGLLMLCKTVKAYDDEAQLADQANKLGLSAIPMGPKELQDLDPGIEMEVAGGVHFVDDAHLTPPNFMRALTNHVRSLGGNIRTGCDVNRIETRGDRITSAQGLHADHFVIAAGVWSTTLCKSIGIYLPMLAGKGYGFTVTNPPETPNIPSILAEARVAVTPMTDGLRFVGTMELGPPEGSVNMQRVSGIQQSIGLYYPRLREVPKGTQPVWMGLRPCSPDGMPYIGRVSRYKNLVIASGHAMMGMSLGPVTGKLVAELLLNESAFENNFLLSPTRFIR